jgi:AraC-like DNA-binding protein
VHVSSPSAALANTPYGIFAMTTATATILALLLLPVLFLLWATESRQQRARRWRRDGWTQQRIADRLGCSRTTVRRLLAA